MNRRERRFPLVADDEVLVGENPSMSLYDEQDLISNIRGHYQEKYDEMPIEKSPQNGPVPSAVEQETVEPVVVAAQTVERPRTQGQLAREAARADLKRKQAAAYLTESSAGSARGMTHSSAPKAAKEVSQLTRLANHLHQSEYILADMPAVYSLDKEERAKDQATVKNSYDFLKKSQVYNYPEHKVQQEKQFAEELNLTYMKEEK